MFIDVLFFVAPPNLPPTHTPTSAWNRQAVHLVRAAEAYGQALKAIENVSDGQLWMASLKPLLRLGATGPAAQVATVLPGLIGGTPTGFHFAAAELLLALGMFEGANGHLFACFVETGPPASLKQEHLVFAMGRLFRRWEKAASMEEVAPELRAERAIQATALFKQACGLSLHDANLRKHARLTNALAASATTAEEAEAAAAAAAASPSPPDPSPEEVNAWLQLGKTWVGYGDAFSAAGYHLLAQDCYVAAVTEADNLTATSGAAWLTRISFSVCMYLGFNKNHRSFLECQHVHNHLSCARVCARRPFAQVPARQGQLHVRQAPRGMLGARAGGGPYAARRKRGGGKR